MILFIQEDNYPYHRPYFGEAIFYVSYKDIGYYPYHVISKGSITFELLTHFTFYKIT